MQQSVELKYRFGPFTFLTPDHTLFRESEQISLDPKTADLLLVFLDDPGKLITKDDLIKRAWSGAAVSDSNLTFQIHQLRQGLGENGDRQEYVTTVPRRGYRFSVPVVSLDRTQPAELSPAASTQPVEVLEPVDEPAMQRPVPPVVAVPRRGSVWPAFGVLAAVAVTIAATVALTLLRAQPSPLRIANSKTLTHDGGIKQAPLITDGVLIYFPTLITAAVASISVHGSEPALLPRLAKVRLKDVSRARSEFLATKEAPGGTPELWAISVSGSSERRVGDMACDAAAWSPDGEYIVCSVEKVGEATMLWIVDAAGKGRRHLVNVRYGIDWIRWSPDGSRIRFVMRQAELLQSPRRLWEVLTDGTQLRQVLSAWRADETCCGTWTHDGMFYVFQALRDGRYDLWALQERVDWLGRPVEIDPIQLTFGPMDFTWPMVSVDDKSIFAMGQRGRGELVRYDAKLQQFVPYLGGISAAWVTFSPDRQSVVYIDFPGNTLWRARADGSEKQQLTFVPLEVAGVAWSPDSTRLAIRAGPAGKPKKIHLIPASGGTPEPLVPDDVEQGIPGWSPDGKYLVFGDVPEVFGYPKGTEVLHIFDLSTKAMTTLPGSNGLWTARWSPDGRYISALTIDLPLKQTLRLFDWKTKQWRQTAATHVNNTTWSTDSAYVYYDTETQQRWLRRLRVADGKVEDLVSLHAYPVAHYGWSGLSLDGSPTILGQRYDVEIYALTLDRP